MAKFAHEWSFPKKWVLFYLLHHASYQREQESEIDGRYQPVGAGSRIAAVVAVHVSGSLAAEAVEQAQNVAHQDQEDEAGHAEADVISVITLAKIRVVWHINVTHSYDMKFPSLS